MKGKAKRIILVLILAVTAKVCWSQDFALKTNSLYWLATTPNIGLEAALGNRFTLDIGAAYNPWTFNDDKKMRFWLVQPEFRYWFCEKFEGHFVGLHLHGAQFFGGFSENRYDGYLAGAGVTYGYDWILSLERSQQEKHGSL